MTAPDYWRVFHPVDVILDAESEARCALATLVAIEALREGGDELVNWHEGTVLELLGHFDNLLACARLLANHHGALLDYLRQEIDTNSRRQEGIQPSSNAVPSSHSEVTDVRQTL